jgi:hypothetical protein
VSTNGSPIPDNEPRNHDGGMDSDRAEIAWSRSGLTLLACISVLLQRLSAARSERHDGDLGADQRLGARWSRGCNPPAGQPSGSRVRRWIKLPLAFSASVHLRSPLRPSS